MTSNFDNPDELTSDACQLAMERLQQFLDGQFESELSDTSLETDSHLAGCIACRERVALARLVCATLAKPSTVAVPPELSARIVAAVSEVQPVPAPRWRSASALGVIAAIAASLLLAGWYFTRSPEAPMPTPNAGSDLAQTPNNAVINTPNVPEPPPLRLGDELAKAGSAIRFTQDSITLPLTGGSTLVAKLTDQLITPTNPASEPEPAQTGLSAIPDATLSSLEPVTNTARKAFSRLVQDVGFVSIKPKS